MTDLEWSEEALDDLGALDKATARRIKRSVERFAEIGIGDIKKLKGPQSQGRVPLIRRSVRYCAAV